MDSIVSLFVTAQTIVGKIAGFGVDDSYSAASFTLLVAMSLFGTACISHLAERTGGLHLAFNLIVMFAGGVFANAVLRGVHLPLGHELLVTTVLTLIGMTATALVLLVTYRKTDF